MGSCYRYGGERDDGPLPKHNLQQAAVVAEQICMSIAKLTFEKSSENITASIGLTSYPEVTKAVDESFWTRIAMVYQAKDDGGNAVRGAMGSEMKQDSARTMRLDIASRVEAVELWIAANTGKRSILFRCHHERFRRRCYARSDNTQKDRSTYLSRASHLSPMIGRYLNDLRKQLIGRQNARLQIV